MERPKLSRRTLGRSALATAAAMTLVGTARADDDVRGRVSAILPDLVTMLDQGMSPWQIPGVAVGVVVGEDVLLARGFGKRQVGAPEAVDADTVFQIGSTTKAFAATTEAMLVDAGKLGWMDRVIDHDPDFRMFDPWVTQEFRIIDLLSQRSGLRPYSLDSLWFLGYSAEEIVTALRHIAPVSSFRAQFGYQNITHQVAGRIVARLAGVPRWQDAVAKLIFEPLGMSSTSTSAEALLAAPNRATGHLLFADKLTPVPPIPELPYTPGPAGGMNSSVNDMTKWLRLQIGRGTFAGTRLLGAHALEATWKPQVNLDPKDGFPSVWQGYASGWIVRQTAGGVAIWHNGGTLTFKTHVGFVPALGVGLVVLTNEGSNEIADATGLWFYDRLLDNAPVDYGAEILTHTQEALAKAAVEGRRPAAPQSPGPDHDYTGAYHSDVAGDAEVAATGGEPLNLTFKRPGTRFGLRPWSGDVFVLTARTNPALAQNLEAGAPQLVQFLRTAQGRVERVRLGEGGEIELARAANG